MLVFLWKVVVFTFFLYPVKSANVSHSHRLLQHLIDSYPRHGKYVLPLRDTENTLAVEIGLTFTRILSVDRAKQTISYESYNTYIWRDDYLTWDPGLYEGVDTLMVPVSTIWVPDITIYDLVSQTCTQSAAAVVYNNGTLLLVPSCVQQIRCFVDVTYFPFDKHSCTINMGSWTQHNDSMTISKYNIYNADGQVYAQKHQEWDLYKVTSYMEYQKFREKHYPFLRITFNIRHHAALCAFLLILPAVLLSIMTSVVFLLPCNDDNKINIGLSIFLSFMVLLHILMDMTPQSSSTVPYLGYYFTVNSLLIAMSVFSATITSNMCAKAETDDTMPVWLKKIMILIAKALMVNMGPNNETKTWKSTQELENQQVPLDNIGMNPTKHCSNRRDWIQLAWALDRLFLLIYMFINVVASVVIFVQYTHT